MTAFMQHFTFEFKSGLRNSTAMLMNYLFPLAFYALMGLVMTQVNPGFKAFLLPAMVIFASLASNLLGLPGPLVESRDAGVFRSFKINGVPAASILSIPAMTSMFHALIVSVIISLTAGPFFGGATPVSWGYFILITLLMAFMFGALGALIGVIANGVRSTVLWSQLIFLPSMMLGGLMMPLDVLPESVRFISGLLPTAYAMQAYQGLAFNAPTVFDPAISLLVVAAAGLIAFTLAIYLFSWDSKNSTRRGHPLMALLVLVPFVAGMLLA
jgi:ABC-2 type transport system permease protein